jgi:transcriptional regulator with XRE-family HTH domain
MSERIAALARRVEDDPFFLAAALKIYRESEQMSDNELAREIGCSTNALPLVALCRWPRSMPPAFQRDVEQIAARFGLNPAALAQVVRRAAALSALRDGPAAEAGLLLAARDREPAPTPTLPLEGEGAELLPPPPGEGLGWGSAGPAGVNPKEPDEP